MLKWLKRISLIIISIFLLLSIIPYLIPIKPYHNNEPTSIFENSHIITIDDVFLHYRVWQPEEVRGKILMVHGLGGSTYSFRNNVDILKDAGYLVIGVDLPGFGYSDRKLGLEHSQKARSKLLWKLLDSFDNTLVNEVKEMKWFLAGHSMGGGTVAAMSIENEARAAGLIIIDGALFNQENILLSLLLHYPPFERGLKVFLQYGINEGQIKSMLTSAYGREPSEDEVSGYLEPLLVEGTIYSLVDIMKTTKNENVELLNDLTIPMLLIWGKKDTWVAIEEADKIKKIVPSVEVKIIDNGYHCSMETNVDKFNNILLTFLITN